MEEDQSDSSSASSSEEKPAASTRSKTAACAGKEFAGGWRCAFAAFKADLEARVVVHKLVRNWASNSICEHCLASKKPALNYRNFRSDAPFLGHIFTHAEFLMLNPPERQSAWTCVRGWDKDRNLDDPRAYFFASTVVCMVGFMYSHRFLV